MKNCKLEVSSRFLKDLAIITMVFNHACYAFMNAYGITEGFWYEFQWIITWLSFVLFAFMISEGMYRTHDRSKYIFRLGLLALISEIPYDYCWHGVLFYPKDFNIFFTLFLGAVAIDLLEKYTILWNRLVVCAVVLIIGYYLEYGIVGIGIILAFYFLRNRPVLMYSIIAVLLFLTNIIATVHYLPVYEYNVKEWISSLDWASINQYTELFGVLAFPFIWLYKGKKGNSRMPAWFFYAFYPAHLVIIAVLVKLIHG